MSTSPRPLLVPLNVAARVVDDTMLAVYGPDYSDLATRYLLADSEGQAFAQAKPTEHGVALHWALPAALTRGKVVVRLSADAVAHLEKTLPNVPYSLNPNYDGSDPPSMQPLTVLKELAARAAPYASVSALLADFESRVDASNPLVPWLRPLITELGSSIEMPSAPNRWLVTRHVGDQRTSWVVESDALADANAPTDTTGPLIPKRFEGAALPPTGLTQSLGRRVELAAWSEGAGERLPHLSALGAGAPEFAAIHGLCRNVFGFVDDYQPAPGAPLAYSVIGWHSDASDDPLTGRSAASLRDDLGWELTPADAVPGATLYHGQIVAVAADPAPVDNAAATTVALGASVPEALAALLADRLPNEARTIAEPFLTALQLGLLARHSEVDDLSGIDAALHQHDFMASDGGALYGIKRVRDPSPDDVTTQLKAGAVAPRALRLPPKIIRDLEALNRLRVDLDAGLRELASLRRMLFTRWRDELGGDGTGGASDEIDTLIPWIDQLQVFVGEKMAAVASAAGALGNELATLGGEALRLFTTRAPRFWAPREPALVIQGPDAQIIERRGPLGAPLPCRRDDQLVSALAVGEATLPAPSVDATALAHLPFPSTIAALLAEATLLDPGATTELAASHLSDAQRDQVKAWLVSERSASAITPKGTLPAPLALAQGAPPWLPVLVQWQVQITPLQDPQRDVEPTLLTESFELSAGAHDLQVKPGVDPSATPVLLSGTTILSAQVTVDLERELERELSSSGGDFKGLVDWLDGRPRLVAQQLSGLNAAMLSRCEGPQLPAVDARQPWRVSDDDGFAVSNRVLRQGTASSLPSYPFLPLRSGTIALHRLRLIDTFGRYRDLLRYDENEASGSQATSSLIGARPVFAQSFRPGTTGAWMAPRLVQPSRLLFRWRSGANDAIEMGSDPTTSPIFGWILFNHLDESLAIFDADGRAIGSLRLDGTTSWEDPPGGAVDLRGLAALQDFTNQAKTWPAPLRAAIHASIHEALQLKNPRGSSDDVGLALLIGRPLALVRAALSLELAGLPALRAVAGEPLTDANFASLDVADFAGACKKISGGVGDVAIPLRLGDPARPHDGLVGYFVASGGAIDYSSFYAVTPASTSEPTPGLVDPAARPLHLTPQTSQPHLGSGPPPATLVTLVMDPRAPVHARVGVVPEKALEIPPEMYGPQLRRLCASFLTAPLLCDGDVVSLPLPREPGYRWLWVDRTDTAHLGAPAAVPPPLPRDMIPSGPTTLREGWLVLAPDEPASGGGAAS